MDNRIRKLSVKNLFGRYYYDLPIESDIMIFHALNGCGKTTIMKLIRAVIATDLAWIHEVIFREFSVFFSNGASITVRKNIQAILDFDKEIAQLKRKDLAVGYEPGAGAGAVVEGEHLSIRNQITETESNREKAFAFQKGEYIFRLASGEEMQVTVNFGLIDIATIERITGYTKKCTEGLIVHYISAGRLYSVDGDKTLCDATTHYIDQISEQINKAMQESRPFFLDKQRAMAEFGMSVDDIIHYEYHDMNIDPVYEIYKKVKALQGYLDKTFKLPDKSMHMSYNDHEIYFMTEAGSYVKAVELSSGEKNLLVLLVYLLFYCGENSVVLLDEPEISMHISWQMNFVDVIIEIMQQNGFQTIIPTHSPSIISDHWDVTVGLGEDGTDE